MRLSGNIGGGLLTLWRSLSGSGMGMESGSVAERNGRDLQKASKG
jgi:hypothetical protein